VTKAVVAAVGSERTGIRLSPWSTFQAMKMDDPIPQFTYLIKGLKDIGLSYLHIVESRIQGNAEVESSDRLDFAVEAWGGISPIFVAGGFTGKSAKEAVDVEYKGKDVAIVFGRYFISNPDLVFRIEKDLALTKYERTTFYKAQSTDGFTDYPFSEEWTKEKSSHL
jgi:NADPH2 dehydrogenase